MVQTEHIHDAFLAAYDQHADALFRFVYFRTGSRDDAHDITQEAFLRTWRYMAEGKEVNELRAFLYKTAKHILYDLTKQKHVRNTYSLDAFLDEGNEVADTTPPSDYDKLDVERALKLLESLEPPDYREVIYLRFIEDLGITEIATALEVSENVVSVRINRALKKLKAQFPEATLSTTSS